MPSRAVLPMLVVGLGVAAAAAGAPAIAHAGVGGVVAEKFPRLEARIAPADAVARALVHFRTDPARPWELSSSCAPTADGSTPS
jgi:hypothetical protein